MYESGENYLEAILMIENVKGTVHSVDVAAKLNVSKPSVSRAVTILKNDGYLQNNEGTELKFTEKGRAKAEDVYSRHQILTEFFHMVTKVPLDQAEENACRVEHVVDSDIMAGIEKWMKAQEGKQSF